MTSEPPFGFRKSNDDEFEDLEEELCYDEVCELDCVDDPEDEFFHWTEENLYDEF